MALVDYAAAGAAGRDRHARSRASAGDGGGSALPRPGAAMSRGEQRAARRAADGPDGARAAQAIYQMLARAGERTWRRATAAR